VYALSNKEREPERSDELIITAKLGASSCSRECAEAKMAKQSFPGEGEEREAGGKEGGVCVGGVGDSDSACVNRFLKKARRRVRGNLRENPYPEGFASVYVRVNMKSDRKIKWSLDGHEKHGTQKPRPCKKEGSTEKIISENDSAHGLNPSHAGTNEKKGQ